jgi:hypothetical protein
VFGVGPGSNCCTCPSSVGLNVWLTSPVALSNAKRFCRVYCVPFIGSVTVVKRPPAIIVSPTWTILVTSPSVTQGVFLLGTSDGIRLAGSMTMSAGAPMAAAGDVTAAAGWPMVAEAGEAAMLNAAVVATHAAIATRWRDRKRKLRTLK